jgi:dephospho-CoA kinase
MVVIGLTGGIGMGKSTAAAAFRRAGLPVFDADAVVHRLQAPGGRAVRPIARAFPATVRCGTIDRQALRAAVLAAPEALKRLEAIIHPLVRREQRAFLARARRARRPAAVLDIPLLFETGGDRLVDFVVVVSAPRDIQFHRVRARQRMSDENIAAVIARQMPDREKRRRADLVIATGLSRHHALRTLHALIRSLLASPAGSERDRLRTFRKRVSRSQTKLARPNVKPRLHAGQQVH